MSSTNWEELGIHFSVVPVERSGEAIQFMHDYFIPDEPIFRSLGYRKGNSWLMDKMVEWWIHYDAIKPGSSVMATDNEGKMVGLRLGRVEKKENILSEEKFTNWIAWATPFCLWSQLFGKMAHILRLTEAIGYEPGKSFDELSTDVMYGGISVVVAKKARVRGLGTELIRQSMTLAESLGCEYMHLLATGEYSGRIFHKLNFTLDKEYLYENFTDFRTGEKLMTDTREHKTGRVFHIKLNPITENVDDKKIE